MASEFNNIPLINADGILEQDERNTSVYDAYSMKELNEYSSNDFVKKRQFSEFNDKTDSTVKEEEDDDNKSRQNASSLAQSFVALCAGAVIIAGSYYTAVIKDTDSRDLDTINVSSSDLRWEWSEDHTSADAVLVVDDEEIVIPAEVNIEEKPLCTSEGEVDFYAKAPAGNDKYYYGEYTEALPPKGHDFEVYASGINDDGKMYADYVCTTCGEHFIVNAEYLENLEGSAEGSAEDTGE